MPLLLLHLPDSSQLHGANLDLFNSLFSVVITCANLFLPLNGKYLLLRERGNLSNCLLLSTLNFDWLLISDRHGLHDFGFLRAVRSTR